MEKNHWVHDYECITDCFLAVFEHYKTDEVHVFTIGRLRNDLVKFLNFLQQNIDNNEWHISFNGLAFDGQLTCYILANQKRMLRMTGLAAAEFIYAESQNIINRSRNREFHKFRESDMKIKQIDVFKLNHWDNPAKMSSLKWIQCSMDWHNVLDMPIEHTASITTVEELKQIAFYCRNDVKSTKAIMNRNKGEISLRGTLTQTYNIPLYSASEPRLSKELFMHFLSQKTGISKNQLRQLRTFRKAIYVDDIILPYTHYEVPEFKDLLWKFKKLIINPDNLKGSFKYSVNYRGLKTDFGLGGVHGAKRGVYESDEYVTIMSSDVVSYYPNLAIRNKWHPAHLPGKEFSEQYEWFFDERVKIPKKDSRNYVYKIILNSTFGLSIDKNSFLYDPEFGMRITINGQLTLMMLYTELVEKIPGAIPLMQNTDGVEIMIPRKYVDLYLQICKDWENTTQLKLEHEQYQKLIVPDVNNYIAIYADEELTREQWLIKQKETPDNLFKRKDGKFYMAKTKCKGRFEFQDRPLHKNKSFNIISKALYYFFVYGTKPEDYIKTNTNIFDFCGQTKATGDWTFIHHSLKNGVLNKEPIQKTLRYYISNKGGKVIKYNTVDRREINVEAGAWLQTIFNLYQEKPFNEYNIDYKFYLDKIKKEIITLQPNIFSNQTSLEFPN